jgi:hypothetical protein
VFGRPCHLRFTFPPQISHLIQAGFRFYGVFGSLYLLGKAPLCDVFGILYGLRYELSLNSYREDPLSKTIANKSNFFTHNTLNKNIKINQVPSSTMAAGVWAGRRRRWRSWTAKSGADRGGGGLLWCRSGVPGELRCRPPSRRAADAWP